MKGGNLEVLIVSAEGIIHTNVIGKPKYYVIIEYGTQVYKSRVIKGKHEIIWNEKFVFELSSTKPENMSYLKIRIMDEEYFTDGGLVGQTLIYLKGIITEADEEEGLELRPSPYNVVLEDDTYKGQIKIGLKFIPNAQVLLQTEREDIAETKECEPSFCKKIMNIWETPCWRFFSSYWNTSNTDKSKPN